MENYLNLEKLSNDLKNLFQNQNQNESYFDFEIICEQNQISFKAHKSILSSRSQYFKSLFKSKMKEYQENKMILKDVSSSILFPILNYFYSGKIEINLENAIQILIFSSKYLIDELIQISSNFIKNNLQIETIVDVLKLSEAMNFNQLLNSSYQFISDNFNKFIKTSFFLELEENHLNSILSNDLIPANEFELFQKIMKWGKHKLNINQKKLEKEEKKQLQIQISNIIDKIRFIDFSKQELENILKQDLIPNEISQKLIQFQKLENENDEKELKQFIQKENQNLNSLIFKPRIKLNSSEIIKDKEHIKKIQEWINDDEFFYKMKKGFSGKKDRFNSQKWHNKCDDKGKTLVIIKTKNNCIFGGFTSVGWTTDKSKWSKENRNNSNGWIPDSNAFIFSLRNDKGDRKPEKLPIKKDSKEHAIYYNYSSCGPTFGEGSNGGCDISLNFNLQNGCTNAGNYYKLPKGLKFNSKESRGYLAGSHDKWVVEELETYFL
ncbi:pep-cterm sorting domain-containing protein [Anaeramoeba ignava]|uniref:Pep-cterm sorting domain-containing protein n=1 Tax=Anaeramoeba ignava TaxID=1746090 RepID=A0A9Q0LLD5_ANAIG|nr:pep-cterm sorting domain-containing protein [Anaeramoeba ignava]